MKEITGRAKMGLGLSTGQWVDLGVLESEGLASKLDGDVEQYSQSRIVKIGTIQTFLNIHRFIKELLWFFLNIIQLNRLVN